tara:strand:+ start:9997 stop:12015 length:2019 start_codon:yes stop_codon:yes gene_type:complete
MKESKGKTSNSPAKKKAPAKKAVAKKSLANSKPQEVTPLIAEEAIASSTRSRRNSAGVIQQTDRFKNIEDGLIPFKYSSGYENKSTLDIRDAVILCQKAYYNFSVFRNTIDIMTEFSVNNIYLRKGTKKSRAFFEALFSRIDLLSLQDKFFREYYRSGNVFIHRFDANVKKSDLQKMSRAFGFTTKANQDAIIPAKYVVLNPADIQLTGTLSFAEGNYSKVVSNYELARLKNPQTEEEIELVNNLPDEIKKQLKNRSRKTLSIPLDINRVTAVFYKKQDYEPFAVPMGYPVLDDINSKTEMKKVDMAIARTMQQAILLVTMGAPPDQGGINQKNLVAMQELFTNQSVGRVLIADYTTKAEFVIPNIGALLDPKKYDVLDRDIRVGLNNILVGENEKFANQSIKVKIFIERLKQAREIFINEFLYPEIKRICRELKFKNYPVPYFDDIDLRDNLQYARIYTRLLELGILTPEEGIDAIEKGRLPDLETSLEDQEEYRKLRDKGFYEPILGGPQTQEKMADKQMKHQKSLNVQKNQKKENGRPVGTDSIPQEKERNPTDRQNSTEVKAYFEMDKIKENLITAQKLNLEVEKQLRKKHKLRKLSRSQKDVAEQITELIIANEDLQNWNDSIDKYLEKPEDYNKDRVKEIQSIAMEHQVDHYLASILYASKTEKKL